MPLTYEVCPKDVDQRAEKLIAKIAAHKDLESAGVRIDFLFASGAVLKCKGRPCYAYARVIPLKDRAAGRRDAEIVISKERWDHLPAKTKNALLDHELMHFAVQKDGAGSYKFDDLHRPKLSMREHDFEIGWFHEVAERHGVYSIEVQQCRKFVHDAGNQYYFVGMEPDAPEAPGIPSAAEKTDDEE